MTIKVAPAMAANVAKRLWEMNDIAGVLEASLFHIGQFAKRNEAILNATFQRAAGFSTN
jgi:hypothetical protein